MKTGRKLISQRNDFARQRQQKKMCCVDIYVDNHLLLNIEAANVTSTVPSLVRESTVAKYKNCSG